MELLNLTKNVSNSPCGHKMAAYILLKLDNIYLLKQIQLGVLLYVVNIHPYFVFLERALS